MKEQFKAIYQDLISLKIKTINEIKDVEKRKNENIVFSNNSELKFILLKLKKQLVKIETAINQITSYSGYGICVECLEEVSIQRIKADPLSTLCLDCQIEVEHKKRYQG